MMKKNLYDCIIIGAGPGGLVAGTYLARFKRNIIIIDRGKSRAHYIPISYNIPGFVDGISGSALLKKIIMAISVAEINECDFQIIANNKLKLIADGDSLYFDVIYAALGSHIASELGIKLGAKCKADNSLTVDDRQETTLH